MASGTRRIAVVHLKALPTQLSSLVSSKPGFSLTKAGLCDYATIRACRVIITMQWNGTLLEADLWKGMDRDLGLLAKSGIILSYEMIK